MAIAFTNLETSSATNAVSGFTATTGSVSIPNNSAVYLCAAAAGNSATPVVAINVPLMTGLTFVELATAVFGARRRGSTFRAINTSGAAVVGTIAIGIDPGANTAQEVMWSIVSATGVDTVTPNGTVAAALTGSGVTTQSANITGTPAAGDAVLACFAHTGATSAMTLTGETDVSLVELGNGTNVRRIKVAYDLTPDATPTASVSWTGAEDSYGIAFIVRAGAGGGDATSPILSSPTATSAAPLTCQGSVSTDEANGTLYTVFTASATAPTAAQVKLGQDNAGAAALRAVNQAVTAAGVQNIASGAITAGTRFAHYMHEDASANQSAVVSSASFVVAAGFTITTDILEDETGATLSSVVIDTVYAVRLSDDVLVATWSAISTQANGTLILADAALTAVPHVITTIGAANADAGAKVYTPA